MTTLKEAQDSILAAFALYKSITSEDNRHISSLTGGKTYELTAVAFLVSELTRRGFVLSFVGNSIKFKASPGYVYQNDPHFDVRAVGGQQVLFQIFTDIEVLTLGSTVVNAVDNGCYHEIDIAVIQPGSNAIRPAHYDVALAIECKSNESLKKAFVREVLGLRRELSLLVPLRPSTLSTARSLVLVPADPPSEIWLIYADGAGNKYEESPKYFGIELRHLQGPS